MIQFCHKIAKEDIPLSDLQDIQRAIDKLIDFCLLIETQAYVTATIRCDVEVVKGLSHQVRNPITIIGGNIISLQKESAPGSRQYNIYESIMSECRRFEHMLIDKGVYSDLYQDDHYITDIDLEPLISKVLVKLKKKGVPKNLRVEIALDRQHGRVKGIEKEYEIMFYNVLQNGLDALNPDNPYVRISSEVKAGDSPFIHVEIFNAGVPVNEKDLDNLFVPFFHQNTMEPASGCR